jgi:hypothetical protein
MVYRLLLWVQDKTGVIPNVPTRACEYVMGRIRYGTLGQPGMGGDKDIAPLILVLRLEVFRFVTFSCLEHSFVS